MWRPVRVRHFIKQAGMQVALYQTMGILCVCEFHLKNLVYAQVILICWIKVTGM